VIEVAVAIEVAAGSAVEEEEEEEEEGEEVVAVGIEAVEAVIEVVSSASSVMTVGVEEVEGVEGVEAEVVIEVAFVAVVGGVAEVTVEGAVAVKAAAVALMARSLATSHSRRPQRPLSKTSASALHSTCLTVTHLGVNTWSRGRRVKCLASVSCRDAQLCHRCAGLQWHSQAAVFRLYRERGGCQWQRRALDVRG
jgi:hypothetical protein